LQRKQPFKTTVQFDAMLGMNRQSANRKYRHIFAPFVAAVILSGTLASTVAAVELPGLGSGDPGLKVATRGADAIVIYKDEAETVGVGLIGGMESRKIEVLIDRQYHFQQNRMDIPRQLYPFDAESAFTCEGGAWSADFKHWQYTPRRCSAFRLVDGQLTTFTDVQKVAAEKYRLGADEVFLGLIDNRVFFWRGFNPARVYWRQFGDDSVYSVDMPKDVIDLFGATRGIRGDVGFVVFRKSTGFFSHSPYTHGFTEIFLSKGVAATTP
jgi:hypothetical protein